MIYIVGLGPNEEKNIKQDIKEFLLENKDNDIIVRTKEHPAISFLDENNINYETCDKFYIENNNFENTYNAIANYILEKNKKSDVIYLVPGHPMVAELTTKLILEKDETAKVIGGESFLDSCFNAAKFDPVEGFTLVDATNIELLKKVDATKHLLITQCYDDITAGNISIELMEYYPYDHEVLIMENVGCKNEKLYYSELCQLSATVGEEVNNLRTIYVSPLEDAVDYNIKNYLPSFEETSTTSSKIISNIRKELTLLKENSDNVSYDMDEKVAENIAQILNQLLQFTASEDFFVELDDIMRKLKEIQNG